MLSVASQICGQEAWDLVTLARCSKHFNLMKPALNKIFCVPASSAPGERVFSYSGIIARPHRARLREDMRSSVFYLKCNEHIH